MHDITGTLDIRPRTSRLLARFLAAIHIVSTVTVLIWVPGREAVTTLLMLVLLSFTINYRRHVLHRGWHVVRRVVCHDDGRWVLQDHLGEMQPARLLPSSYLHPRLVILNFALEHRPRRRHLVLCPDSLDAQTLRRLRARLRVTGWDKPDAQYHQS